LRFVICDNICVFRSAPVDIECVGAFWHFEHVHIQRAPTR
jgi:hypothetical protein